MNETLKLLLLIVRMEKSLKSGKLLQNKGCSLMTESSLTLIFFTIIGTIAVTTLKFIIGA